MVIYKFLSDYVGQIEVYNFEKKVWESIDTIEGFTPDKIFENFSNIEEFNHFKLLAHLCGGMLATIMDMDSLEEEDLEYSPGVDPGSYCYISKGLHWVDRVAYFIYRIVDPLLRDPLDQNDERNVVCCLW